MADLVLYHTKCSIPRNKITSVTNWMNYSFEALLKIERNSTKFVLLKWKSGLNNLNWRCYKTACPVLRTPIVDINLIYMKKDVYYWIHIFNSFFSDPFPACGIRSGNNDINITIYSTNSRKKKKLKNTFKINFRIVFPRFIWAWDGSFTG